MVSDVISGLGWDCTDLRLGWGVEHLTLPINPTKKVMQIWSASLHWSHFANSCELRKRSLISLSLGLFCLFHHILDLSPLFPRCSSFMSTSCVLCNTFHFNWHHFRVSLSSKFSPLSCFFFLPTLVVLFFAPSLWHKEKVISKWNFQKIYTNPEFSFFTLKFKIGSYF